MRLCEEGKRQANFIYAAFKFDAFMLIAAWHCPCNGAAPASLLRYGLRHRNNSGFAGTEPDEAPYARTGIITHDGNDSYTALLFLHLINLIRGL